MKTKRVLFYSHDTFGLGHIRRTQKIANQLASEEHSILIACSSPVAKQYLSSAGIEYLNLPGFTKLQSGKYIPRNLNIELEEFVAIRSSLLLTTVKSFKPDVFIVDKEPLGVKKELLPSLEYIQKELPNCHTICGIRDILDSPQQVEKEWTRRGSDRALKEFYKSIFIYGDRSIYDFCEHYEIARPLREQLQYVGYIHSEQNFEAVDKSIFGFEKNNPLVTMTLGGGEDGDEFLNHFINMLEERPDRPFNTVVVTGPFLTNGRYRAFADRIEKFSDVKIFNFVKNMPEIIKRSQAIVSMGGYNTFTECLSAGKKPLILPRIVPRQEQLIRAEVFAQRGLCDYIHPDDITTNVLFEKIMLQIEETDKPKPFFNNQGLDKAVSYIKEKL